MTLCRSLRGCGQEAGTARTRRRDSGFASRCSFGKSFTCASPVHSVMKREAAIALSDSHSATSLKTSRCDRNRLAKNRTA